MCNASCIRSSHIRDSQAPGRKLREPHQEPWQCPRLSSPSLKFEAPDPAPVSMIIIMIILILLTVLSLLSLLLSLFTVVIITMFNCICTLQLTSTAPFGEEDCFFFKNYSRPMVLEMRNIKSHSKAWKQRIGSLSLKKYQHLLVRSV